MHLKVGQIILFSLLICLHIQAQKNVRTFIFGHSLINHELQVNPTPSQETSVPHWLYFLAEDAGHELAVSGQYGFLPQHANLPPIAQWGFDFVPSAWESDYEPFSEADFNQIIITPGNFIQWQGPEEPYYKKAFSPIDATKTVFSWCNDQEENLRFYIYENWPDMAPFLGSGFPPSESEWQDYIGATNSHFHDWFLTYHDSMRMAFPDACISMIPVGPLMHQLLALEPFDQIPIDQLYEDDAPHGRPTIYFLASMITYMAIYEEPTPIHFQIDQIIHPIVGENYQVVRDFFWSELQNFQDHEGNSRVFCDQAVSHIDIEESNHFRVYPNPASQILNMDIYVLNVIQIEICDVFGKRILNQKSIRDFQSIDISDLPSGVYTLTLRDENLKFIDQQLFVKI